MYTSTQKIAEQGLALNQLLAQWRFATHTIVMTNGCFDLLHLGHVDYLERARALGHKLVVALNDDDSIRRLKGPSRPIQSLEARSRILAALESVDLVISFAEETPIELIRLVRPHVLVKGADYRPEAVVGANELPDWGGRLELLSFVEGQSTTNLVQKMREAERTEEARN